jgi:hypothetical protein
MGRTADEGRGHPENVQTGSVFRKKSRHAVELVADVGSWARTRHRAGLLRRGSRLAAPSGELFHKFNIAPVRNDLGPDVRQGAGGGPLPTGMNICGGVGD